MTYRYTDRDCWAALLRLAAAQRRPGNGSPKPYDVGVSLPPDRRPDWRRELRQLAEHLDVPVRSWNETTADQHAYSLEARAGCYGGGVRPILYQDGSSGHFTPPWFQYSAGLGPGACSREAFVHLVEAASAIAQGRQEIHA
jgi:hypothetical protein